MENDNAVPDPDGDVRERHDENEIEEVESDEEEDEEDEEQPDEPEEDEHPDVLEGGVADADQQGEDIRRAADADITLFFVCTESFDHIYQTDPHPILQPNVTVQIGLGKSTKLDKVMKRYIHVCNEHRPTGTSALALSDLDFSHVQLLNPSDTPEAAAVMKHDRINVSRERRQERAYDQDRIRLQRESDKEFFEQLRIWRSVPNQKNVVLMCKNDTLSVNGEASYDMIRCDAAIVAKRCKWLGALIARAKHQKLQLKIRSQSGSRASNRSEDDDNVRPLHAGGDVNMDRDDAPAAAHIENDDEVMHDQQLVAAARIEYDDDEDREEEHELIHVSLDFPVEAVKLLLEFIYTNRVTAFGMEAFVTACRTRPSDKRMQGPVPPFDIDRRTLKRWPNKGFPLVNFDTCVSSIRMAETASMPRFSLMAEVAASQQLTSNNVVIALTLCDKQRLLSGNALPKLRKAAMDVVLKAHHNVLQGPSLKESLAVHGSHLVPALLAGVVDAIEPEDDDDHHRKRKKDRLDAAPDQWLRKALASFSAVDYHEKKVRERERATRRHQILKGRKASRTSDTARPRGHGLKRSARHMSADGEAVRSVLENLRGFGVETRSMEAKASKRRPRRGGAL